MARFIHGVRRFLGQFPKSQHHFDCTPGARQTPQLRTPQAKYQTALIGIVAFVPHRAPLRRWRSLARLGASHPVKGDVETRIVAAEFQQRRTHGVSLQAVDRSGRCTCSRGRKLAACGKPHDPEDRCTPCPIRGSSSTDLPQLRQRQQRPDRGTILRVVARRRLNPIAPRFDFA